jgi:hypothetical protein
MKNILYTIIICFLFSSLLGCETAYEKKGFWDDGYSETQLSENMFNVTFKGNEYSSMERAIDFTLLRSAEITKENGYNYFLIVNSAKFIEESTYTQNIEAQVINYSISEPHTSNTIFLLKDKPLNGEVFYDASFIIKSIRTKYDMN